MYLYTNILMKNKQSTTSVKIDEILFDKFKIECVRDNFTFQKLAERAVYLYLMDEEFKKQIQNQFNLSLNG